MPTSESRKVFTILLLPISRSTHKEDVHADDMQYVGSLLFLWCRMASADASLTESTFRFPPHSGPPRSCAPDVSLGRTVSSGATPAEIRQKREALGGFSRRGAQPDEGKGTGVPSDA
jgi:hypothetical protein